MPKVIILIFFILYQFAFAADLRPFESDGCTLAPSGTIRQPQKWRDCCVGHDLRYWGGGTKTEKDDADLKLKSCLEKNANSWTAQIYWMGVRLGSRSPWKLPTKKWGNAWYDNVSIRKLSPQEIMDLLVEVEDLEIPSGLQEEYTQELRLRLSQTGNNI